MDDIYTPIEEAGEIIRKRWADEGLHKKVEDRLNGDIPEIMKNRPHGLIWRCICTPDGEFERFLELCKKANLEPIGFENSQDKFYSGNFTKLGLTNLVFSQGINKNSQHFVVKEKIIDFTTINGKKRMCDLKTLWGESLVDFHHFFLQAMFPIMKNGIIDMFEWFKKKGGSPEKYYFSVLSLAICHTVYFDDYDLIESEDSFIKENVLPAFEEVKKYFGIKPIIVRIARVGEHKRDPYWWCYSKEAKIIMGNHVKQHKC